jgi:hypothetical protein
VLTPELAAARVKFVEYLKRGHISSPDNHVLATIAKRYSEQLLAVLDIGITEPCIDLYQTVKDLPTTFTRGVIQNEMKISMKNVPLSLVQPNIFMAVDLHERKHILLKLFRIPETYTFQSALSRKDAVTCVTSSSMFKSV